MEKDAQSTGYTEGKEAFRRFDATINSLLSVSRSALSDRETEWKEKQAQKKQAKTSPASRASTAKG